MLQGVPADLAGVNPRGETDLNDTRAIGLSLGRSFPSRGWGLGKGTAPESPSPASLSKLLLALEKILRPHPSIVSLCRNAWLAVRIRRENSSPMQSAVAADCSIVR